MTFHLVGGGDEAEIADVAFDGAESAIAAGIEVDLTRVRRDTSVEEGCSYYAMEISYNRFERSLQMPVNLANARVTIEARNGLLLVRMITEGNEYA